MRVLMTDRASEPAAAAAESLEGIGHEVVTCNDGSPGLMACAVLRGDSCPFEQGGVDVAVHVDRQQALGIEDAGLLCALRRFVPVVVATEGGAAAPDELSARAAVVCDVADLDRAIVTAVGIPLAAHGRAAEAAANSVLEVAGKPPVWRAMVERLDGRRLRLELASEEALPHNLRVDSSVRAAQAVRLLDTVTPVLDVVIAAPEA